MPTNSLSSPGERTQIGRCERQGKPALRNRLFSVFLFVSLLSASVCTSRAQDAGFFTFSTTNYNVFERDGLANASGGNTPPDGGANQDFRGALVTFVRTNGAKGRMLLNYAVIDGTAL